MDTVRRLEYRDTVARVPSALNGKLVGLAIVSILPALFWTGVLALVGPMIGIVLGAKTLLVIGFSIAVFLSLILSSLALAGLTGEDS